MFYDMWVLQKIRLGASCNVNFNFVAPDVNVNVTTGLIMIDLTGV